MADDGGERSPAGQRLERTPEIEIEGTAGRALGYQGQASPAKRECRLLARNCPGRARHHRLAAVAGRESPGGTPRFLSLQNPAAHPASEKHLRLSFRLATLVNQQEAGQQESDDNGGQGYVKRLEGQEELKLHGMFAGRQV